MSAGEVTFVPLTLRGWARPFTSVLVAFLLGACSGPASVARLEQPTPLPAAKADPEFAPGQSILAGFDQPQRSVVSLEGARALLGIRIIDGTHRTVRFVLIEGLPMPPGEPRFTYWDFSSVGETTGKEFSYSAVSPVGQARVSLFDADATLIRTSDVDIPWYFLTRGPWSVSHRLRNAIDGAPRTDADRAAYADGILSLMSIVQAIRLAPATEPLVNEVWANVIDAPDLVSILFRGGVNLELNAAFEDSARLDPPGPWPLEAAVWMPFPISANGRPTLNAELVCGPEAPPYLLTAGILRLVGHHPRFSDRSLQVELLAARLADGALPTNPSVTQPHLDIAP